MTRKERVVRDKAQKAIAALLHARQCVVDAELWRTYQAIDKAVKAIGWEAAGQLQPYIPKPKKKKVKGD